MSDATQHPEPPPHKPDGWELFCSGVLSTEFGRRRSDALAQAIAQLSGEECPMGWRQRFVLWWGALRPIPRFGIAGACIAIMALSAWMIVSLDLLDLRQPEAAICTVSSLQDLKWANPAHVNDSLSAGTYR